MTGSGYFCLSASGHTGALAFVLTTPPYAR